MGRTKVLLAELNEITWNLIDPLIEQGKLPTFARLKSEGSWGAPLSVDLPPHLDLWITWTTVYTGRPQAEHNVFFLQQPPETIKARRLWEICQEHGLHVGVYGSLCSWPPQNVDGYNVPDTYWKAMDPNAFPLESSLEERSTYGGAIEYGYRTADKLLQKMLALLDDETVLVVACSMGQKPFISNLKKGKTIAQPRSFERLLEILDVKGRANALSTMSVQFNLYPDTSATSSFLLNSLRSAYVDSPDRPMFSVVAVEDSLTVNLIPNDEASDDSRCILPHRSVDNSFRFEDLVYSTGKVKSGGHDPRGVLMLCGPGIKRGDLIGDCNNLDIAPTLLTLLNIPVPKEMKGRVSTEAFVADA